MQLLCLPAGSLTVLLSAKIFRIFLNCCFLLGEGSSNFVTGVKIKSVLVNRPAARDEKRRGPLADRPLDNRFPNMCLFPPSVPSHDLHEHCLGKERKMLVHWSAAKNKGGCRSADKPIVKNWFSTYRFTENSLFSSLQDNSQDNCPRCPWGQGSWLCPWRTARRRPVLPGPALPCRPALRCPEPIRPWYVRVLGSTGYVT